MTQKVAVAPTQPNELTSAVLRAGAELVSTSEAEILVWYGGGPSDLRQALEDNPSIRWVQLPMAGVEDLRDTLDDKRVWTCAKGVYGPLVAELGVSLMLTAARDVHRHIRSHTWGGQSGRTLKGANVLFIGGGGITTEMIRLLKAFGVTNTVVRKKVHSIEGADLTLAPGDMNDAVKVADFVVLALALTPETEGLINAAFLDRMKSDAWIINLARGRHVVTDDLVSSLQSGSIGGAALDVTEPEPLPDSHPLWDMDNVIITPHIANTWSLGLPLLGERVEANLKRDQADEPLIGLVDVALGY